MVSSCCIAYGNGQIPQCPGLHEKRDLALPLDLGRSLAPVQYVCPEAAPLRILHLESQFFFNRRRIEKYWDFGGVELGSECKIRLKIAKNCQKSAFWQGEEPPWAGPADTTLSRGPGQRAGGRASELSISIK